MRRPSPCPPEGPGELGAGRQKGMWGGPSSLLPPGAHMHTRMCTHLYKHTHVHTRAHTHEHTHTWEQAPSVFSRAPHPLHLVPDSWATHLV